MNKKYINNSADNDRVNMSPFTMSININILIQNYYCPPTPSHTLKH